MLQANLAYWKRTANALGLVALLCAVVASVGCGGALRSRSGYQASADPLLIGVDPGPLGSTTPQSLQLRLGSLPSDRIVSLSLDISSLKTTNSFPQDLELLTAPITVEFTRNALTSEPITVREDIYQDTYSTLIFPAMTGQVVFYDVNGQLVSQAISVPGQSIPYSFVLGADPMVLTVTLDLAQSFTITDTAGAEFGRSMSQDAPLGSSSFTVNALVVNAANAVPNPAVGQPESGSFSFVVGTVTNVNESTKKLTVRPSSGDSFQFSYGDTTEFVNCTAATLVGMMVETEGETQANGSVLASEIELINNSQSNSELYGQMSGYAPDGMNFNLIVQGGLGVNVTTGLVGKTVTLDWLAGGYSVNGARLSPSLYPDLVFDEARAFPGQLVEAEWDTLIVPDPDSSNAGLMQPRMLELEEQTLSGQVSNYVYDSGSHTGTFTLTVANNAAIRRMNSGLVTITVRRVPVTYLQNNPTFGNGDNVKVRGLLFADPLYNNSNYHPPDPIKFIMVADRISK